MTMPMPDWDTDPLEHWEPSAAQRARAIELWHAAASSDPDFPNLFRAYCDDVLTERSLPQALLAVIDHGTICITGAVGRDLAVRRLAADLEHARSDAAEEAASR